MAKKKNGKLSIILTFWIAGICILLNVIQATIIIKYVKNKVTNQNIAQYQDVASNYAKIVENKIEGYIAHLDFYTNNDIVKTKDTAKITEWLKSQENKRYQYFDYVAWVDPAGNFLSDIGTKTNIVDRDYFKAIMAKGLDVYIDDAVTSKTSGKTVLHICKAAKVDNKTVGFFCAVIDVTHLSHLLDDIDLGSKGGAILYSGTNFELATNGIKDITDAIATNEDLVKSINEDILVGASGYKIANSNLGKLIEIYAPIEGTRWSMNVVLYYTVITELSAILGRMLFLFSFVIGIAIIIVTALIIYKSIKPLNVVEKALNEIATGNADLTQRIDVKSNNEIGRVVDDFNNFLEKLQTIVSAIKNTKDELVTAGQTLNDNTQETASSITEIISNIESMGTNINTQSNSVNETAGAVNEIASNIESLNNMIESQSAAVTQASTAVEEMIGNINSVNNSIVRMADQFKMLETKAITGLQKQDDVSNKIEIIADESQALQEANTVISNIAEQTNLLAMNAAIEAAHAGEAGKGFSVVADEIRKLSETSSQQSDTIGNQLKKIIDSIEEIVQASKDARQSFSDVSSGINQTTDLVSEITNSMQEQSEGSKQISIALNNMNDTTSEVKTSSFEMSEGNKAILEEIKNLQDATFSMKTGMDEMSTGATQINQSGASLSEIALQMENSISKIGEQVDEFKV